MRDQEKIAWFLIFKANRFNFVEGGAEYAALYLHPKDLAVVLKWNNATADSVWRDLVRLILHGAELFDGTICPFCLKYPCKKCLYAKTHGICSKKSSDYMAVRAWISSTIYSDPERFSLHSFFSNEVYREILNVIENG